MVIEHEWKMAEEGSRKREEELRQQLDQLRWELGQERSAKKQLHHDKVILVHSACSLDPQLGLFVAVLTPSPACLLQS